MKRTIQIDGGGSNNKGAQLMMVAVLQEIQHTCPDAKVIINNSGPDANLINSCCSLNWHRARPRWMQFLINKFHIIRVAQFFSNRLSYHFGLCNPRTGIDIVFNIGGFQFGDQWNHGSYSIGMWNRYLTSLKRHNTKTIFLPQALGPFNKEGSKKIAEVLNNKADLVIARDVDSYDNLASVGFDKRKLLLYPDFTATVQIEKAKNDYDTTGKVCIIPNFKIISHGNTSITSYINTIKDIIVYINSLGKEVFLLNHEGAKDLKICERIVNALDKPIRIYSGNNAIETKSIISTSFMVISSRYHGVANALNTGVPCLATSWSHKYKRLFDDYHQEECIIDLGNIEETKERIAKFINKEENNLIRTQLIEASGQVKKRNKEMWDSIWSFIDTGKVKSL